MSTKLMQSLESRMFLSASQGDEYMASAARSAAITGTPINLQIVALHEMGHALGLDHVSNTSSIMYAYYNPNYNVNNLANDPVIATLKAKFSSPNAGPWKDSLDPNPGNGVVNITYSFMLDGARTDKRANSIFRTLNAEFGSTSAWQSIFTGDLNRWASASGNKIAFSLHSDNGAAFGASGLAQNDSHFGDIRIGAHRFDGTGKVLAHTYFPPPNGGTAAGDLHIDEAENWVAGSSSSITSQTTTFATDSNVGGEDGRPVRFVFGSGDHRHVWNLGALA